MNIFGENNFVYLSRDRPNMFDLRFSDNSCHHRWRLGSTSLYIFVLSRLDHNIFFWSQYFPLCYFLAAMSLANNSELETGNRSRSRREGDQQIGRRSGVQLYSFRTVQNAVQRLYRWILDPSFFYADHSYRSESIYSACSYLCFASGRSPLKHNLAAGSGQSLN